MNSIKHGVIAMLAALVFLTLPARVQAEVITVRICNEHNRGIAIAIAYMPLDHDRSENPPRWQHRGWIEVSAGYCRDVAQTEIPFFYIYAQEARMSRDRYAWYGDTRLCTSEYPDEFNFRASYDAPCTDGRERYFYDRVIRAEPGPDGVFRWTVRTGRPRAIHG